MSGKVRVNRVLRHENAQLGMKVNKVLINTCCQYLLSVPVRQVRLVLLVSASFGLDNVA